MGGEYFPGKGNTKKAPPYSSNHILFGASKVVLVVKDLPVSAGDPGSVPGLGRSPGEGHGNPFKYSCLENPHGQEPGGQQSIGLHRVRLD